MLAEIRHDMKETFGARGTVTKQAVDFPLLLAGMHVMSASASYMLAICDAWALPTWTENLFRLAWFCRNMPEKHFGKPR